MTLMEALFLTTIGWLAADILFASFNGSWYFVVGPLVARGRRKATADGPPPSPQALEKLTSSDVNDGDPRLLEFVRRSDDVYTFCRRKRRGAALLQGSIEFDRKSGSYEVKARGGVFFIAFLISLSVLFVLSHGYDQAGGWIFAVGGIAFLFAFAIQDLRTCARVVEAVNAAWH